MDCELTAFDMAIHRVKPLTDEKDKKECVSILVEDSLPALLDYGVQKKCFSQDDADVFSVFIPKFYSYEEPSYWEEDVDEKPLGRSYGYRRRNFREVFLLKCMLT